MPESENVIKMWMWSHPLCNLKEEEEEAEKKIGKREGGTYESDSRKESFPI